MIFFPYFDRTSSGGTHASLGWCLTLGLAIFLLCLGLGTLCVGARLQYDRYYSVLPGQFTADMRSLLAAIRYLAEPELDDKPQCTPGTADSSALLATSQPPTVLGFSLNQMEMPAPIAGLPARS